MDLSRAFFIHSAQVEAHHYPPDCPFKTERAALTLQLLRSMGYPTGVVIAPRSATTEELLRFHSAAYLETLQRAAAGTLDPQALFMGLGTPETPVFAQLYDYARLAAGASMTGAGLILEGAADLVFNPSGGFHHALSEKAGGFCYVNDVVLACMQLAAAGKRVFCLDIDAHHGNGQQAAFYGTDAVFTLSLHEDGRTLYPWGGFVDEIGDGMGRGYNVNLPVPAGTDDDVYLAAFREVVPPLLKAYRPEVIVLEIGMDILSVDPLTHLSMTNNAVADIVPLLTQFGLPILAVGGGGYHPEHTARGWALAWTALCGIDVETDLYIGLGGTFLGTSEWNAGLRDMHSYRSGSEKQALLDQVGRTVESLKSSVFPLHRL